MSRQRHISEPLRKALLAGLMLVLLAVAVGAAWMVTAVRQQDPQVALDILKDIRNKGLRSYWGDGMDERWYMTKGPSGQPIGWYRQRRLRGQNGSYVAEKVEQAGRQVAFERWMIDETASRASYDSRRPGLVTNIQLEKGQVTFTQLFGNRRMPLIARADAPADFVFHGLEELVMQEAAARGSRTSFSMLISGTSIRGNEVNFEKVLVTPQNERMVLQSYGRNEILMAFDKDGRMSRKSDLATGVVSEISSASAVAEKFPLARPYQQATTAPQTQETEPGEEDDQPATEADVVEEESEGL